MSPATKQLLNASVLMDVSPQQNGSALVLTIDQHQPIVINNPANLAIVIAGNFSDLSIRESISIANEMLAGLGIEVKANEEAS